MSVAAFITMLNTSLSDGSFARLSLSAHHGAEPDLKKIMARPVTIKRAAKLSFTYHYKTRDIVKNYDYADAAGKIRAHLETDFAAAILFTTGFDVSYPEMKKSAPTQSAVSTDHDRAKRRHVDPAGKNICRRSKSPMPAARC